VESILFNVDALPRYAELHCLTNFSFQRGASHPEELVAQACSLGYAALAITDECSVSGVVRAHLEAKKLGLKLLVGAEFALSPPVTNPNVAFKLIALAHNLNGWGNLCEFITAARCSASKGSYAVSWENSNFSDLVDCEILLIPGLAEEATIESGAILSFCLEAKRLFGARLWLVHELMHRLNHSLWQRTMEQASFQSGIPLVAAGNVHMHVRSHKPLQDAITAIRLGKPLSQCGFELRSNAETYLHPINHLIRAYTPELLANTLKVAQHCTFNLDELRYQYPIEAVLPGMTSSQTLRHFTYLGAAARYPLGIAANVEKQIEHELALIAKLKYEMYFLTVHDLVAFARKHRILCQGRGSAANSAVCYCLGVTGVDPSRTNMLFERFISLERNEPPDIDIDFEHHRREEVIQYIYTKYGRERAAIVATVVTYRTRSALRHIGMVLGIDTALISTVAKDQHWFDVDLLQGKPLGKRLQEAGLEALDASQHGVVHRWLKLSHQLLGAPRHLSQHVGGFVLTRGKLTRLVPVENAAMPDRSIAQWDKDDLDAMGLIKVDVLALGMLSAIRRCLDLISIKRDNDFKMQDIPAEDPATYDMICQADTVGVFQIESRAQMSMLPRLRPRSFYDLVIEVAIVRPGPIQGGMVHPYLKARAHPDRVSYPSPALKEVLKRTLGIPIFQEQVMQIAIVAAGFSAGEADDLRRSMAAWKRKGGVHRFYDRLVSGMAERGYLPEFAQAIFKQIEGFGEYGFPESHAASFALITYVSCWLKHHEPACFLTAMLNSQPLGFYSASQLVQDAKRHSVRVLPINVVHSDWDCSLETEAESTSGAKSCTVRLGLRMVIGLSEASGRRIVIARNEAPLTSIEDLALRAEIDSRELKALAMADALVSLLGPRRQQVWVTSALQRTSPLLHATPIHENFLDLPAAFEGEEVVLDYAATGLTLRRHPLAILRPQLAKMGLLTAHQMADIPDGKMVKTCGIVTMRQQPQTAKGVIFVTLEDETGNINVIVWKDLRQQQRNDLLKSRLMAVYGRWQRDVNHTRTSHGEVLHLIAEHLINLTPLLGRLGTASRDFH
jgi:error-prone DNA polymerase